MNADFYDIEKFVMPPTELDHTVECLTRALALRDLETEEHARRVTALTLNLAHSADVPPADGTRSRSGVTIFRGRHLCRIPIA